MSDQQGQGKPPPEGQPPAVFSEWLANGRTQLNDLGLERARLLERLVEIDAQIVTLRRLFSEAPDEVTSAFETLPDRIRNLLKGTPSKAFTVREVMATLHTTADDYQNVAGTLSRLSDPKKRGYCMTRIGHGMYRWGTVETS